MTPETALWYKLRSAYNYRDEFHQGYFSGLMDAYCIIASKDSETVYEEIRDAEIADAEVSYLRDMDRR